MLRRLATYAACFCAFTVCLRSPAARADGTQILADGGVLYSVQSGLMSDLFPALTTPDTAGNRVLALDVTRPGAATQRIMVPDTGGAEVDSSPYAAYDNTTGSVFIVWQEKIGLNTLLLLRSYQADGSWSDAIRIYGNSYAIKGEPRIALTRDHIQLDDGHGGTLTLARTIMHLVWWEDAENGRVLYAPVVLINGVYFDAAQQIFKVSDLGNDADAGTAGTNPYLIEAPRVLSGTSDHSVVIGFANPQTNRLQTVIVSVLPGELGGLADDVRAHIITGGSTQLSDLGKLADDVRAHIITGGSRLSPSVLTFLGDAVRAHIITGGRHFAASHDLAGLANDARDTVVGAGSGLLLSPVTAPSATAASTVAIAGAVSDATSAENVPSQYVTFQPVASWSIPSGPATPEEILVSDAGTAAALAWDSTDGTSLLYREMRSAGPWSDMVRLSLTPSLDRKAALQMLLDHLRGR